MASKQISGIAVFFLVLLAMPIFASAEKCNKIDVATSQNNIVIGSTPQTIQFSMTGRGGPLAPWGDYKNATVSVSPVIGMVNISQPFVDITSLSGAVHNWNFNVTSPGTYNFSVTTFNTTTECSNSALFTATSVVDPVLSASMTNLTEELKANIDYSGFSVNVNNTGLGNAINVVIKVQTNVFSDELISTISNLSAGSSSSVPFTFTPTSCAFTPLEVTVEYKDESGAEKTPLSLSDTFSVNGSDLVVNQLNVSSASISEGGSVSFSALINNTGKINSSGFNLTFYKNSISTANKIAEVVDTDNIGPLETKTVPASWTTSGSGSHSIIAIAKSASGECNTTNSQKTVSLTVNAVSPPSGGTTTDNSNTGPSGGIITIPTPIKTPIPTVPSSLKATPTPTASVEETQIIGTINSGETEVASFSKSSDLNIQQVSITAKNSATGVSVSVEKEKEKPASVTAPSGDVHSYLTITASVKNEDISAAKVLFKVEKSWLAANSVDKNKVSLNRFTAQWDKLATTLLSEDENFAYYSADTPGFSVFSITGEKVSVPTPEAVTGGGGPSGLFLGGQSNLLILVVMVVAAGLIFFLYRRRKG